MKTIFILLVTLVGVATGRAQITDLLTIKGRLLYTTISSFSLTRGHSIAVGDPYTLTFGFDANAPDMNVYDWGYSSVTRNSQWLLTIGDFFSAPVFADTSFEVTDLLGTNTLFIANQTAVNWSTYLGSYGIELVKSGGIKFANDSLIDVNTILSGDYSNGAGGELNWGLGIAEGFKGSLDSMSFSPVASPVPESSTYGLAGAAGLVGVAYFSRNRKPVLPRYG